MARKKIVIASIVVLVLLLAGLGAVYVVNQSAAPLRQQANGTEGSPSQQPQQQNRQEETMQEPDAQNQELLLRVGSREFTATLVDNETVQALKAILPITAQMRDVNSNEKAYDFPDSFPSNASNPGRIENGDIMLYGSRTLVVFYESFSTPYTYTRIGKVNDPSGLKQALGSDGVTVTFQID